MFHKLKLIAFIITLCFAHSKNSLATNKITDRDIEGGNQTRGFQANFVPEVMIEAWSYLEPKNIIPLRVVCQDWHEYIPQAVRELDLSWNVLSLITFTKLSQFRDIRYLDLTCNSDVVDKELSQLTNLRSLKLWNNENITKISQFSNLQSLDLKKNDTVPNIELMMLTQLTELDLGYNKRVTNATLIPSHNLKCPFTNLKSLDLCDNEIINNETVQRITSLTTLGLRKNAIISNETILQLSKLASLDLAENKIINFKSVKQLPYLTSLNISYNDIFTDQAIIKLAPKLISLYLEGNTKITSVAVMQLTNLTYLDLSCIKAINIHAVNAQAVSKLSNLTFLNISNNEIFDNEAVSLLTQLKTLKIGLLSKITTGMISKLMDQGIEVIGQSRDLYK